MLKQRKFQNLTLDPPPIPLKGNGYLYEEEGTADVVLMEGYKFNLGVGLGGDFL